MFPAYEGSGKACEIVSLQGDMLKQQWDFSFDKDQDGSKKWQGPLDGCGW